jgi:Tol biopolymer transport system component
MSYAEESQPVGARRAALSTAAVPVLLALLALAGASAIPSAAAEAPAPASAPVIFAPGVISGPSNDADPCFTADGRTVIFARNNTIMVSHLTGKTWSKPEIAPFSGQWPDQQPTMAPDGSFLVFVSGRPVSAADKTPPAGNLWRVDRRGDGWGEPVHLPATVNRDRSTWAPSIAGDGSLYFIEKETPEAPFHLWRSQARNATYEAAVPVSFGDPTRQDVDPAVAPDESFIVFGSMHPGVDPHERLFIAFREHGGWGKPIDLGDAVNGPGDTNEARLGPDGKTLYYSSDRTLPVKFPRSRSQAQTDQDRIEAWDNSNLNIWSVSLGAWLDAHAKP